MLFQNPESILMYSMLYLPIKLNFCDIVVETGKKTILLKTLNIDKKLVAVQKQSKSFLLWPHINVYE